MEKQVGLGFGIVFGLSAAIMTTFLFNFIKKGHHDQYPGIRILLPVGLMFFPAIPAYIWVWPNIHGASLHDFQVLAYGYILAGTVLIGLRYFTCNQLGLNRNGIGPGMLYGALLIGGRSLVILAVEWQSTFPAFDWVIAVGNLAYCFLIGITEELLFRGLIYQVLATWGGIRLAIWGSSVGFMLWHVFGQGLIVGAAMLLYGLIFALMRWRASGITALIFTHALVDFFAYQMLPDVHLDSLGRPEVPHPVWLLAGLFMIVGVPLFLWLGHDKVFKTYNQNI